MTDLYASPIVRIEQLSSQLEYDITDDNGNLLGKATQVSGPKPRKGFLGVVAGSGLDGARVVVLVSRADGTPLFYVDHQDGAPVAVVAPDGTLIGRFAYDANAKLRALTQNGGIAGMAGMGGLAGIAGVAGMAFELTRPVLAHELLDAQGSPVARIDWELRRRGAADHDNDNDFDHIHDNDNVTYVPVGGVVTDLEGRQIAGIDVHDAVFKDRYALRLLYQLPEPMRTLVIAAPLAFDLSRT